MLLMSCQWKAGMFVNQVALITLQCQSVLPLPTLADRRLCNLGCIRALPPCACIPSKLLLPGRCVAPG